MDYYIADVFECGTWDEVGAYPSIITCKEEGRFFGSIVYEGRVANTSIFLPIQHDERLYNKYSKQPDEWIVKPLRSSAFVMNFFWFVNMSIFNIQPV